MTNYREILRLKSLGLNHSQIAEGAAISRPTVITVLLRASEQGISWQAASELSDVYNLSQCPLVPQAIGSLSNALMNVSTTPSLCHGLQLGQRPADAFLPLG